MYSPRYGALIHFCTNEIGVLMGVWFSIYTLISGIMNDLSTLGVDTCHQLNSCNSDLIKLSIWNPNYYVQCPLSASTEQTISIVLSTSFASIANYIALLSMLACYITLVILFLKRLPRDCKLSGEYVTFVLQIKRSNSMKIYVYINIILMICLSCYATSYAYDFKQAAQIIIGTVLAVVGLFNMLNNTHDLIDINSVQFKQLIFNILPWKYEFGFNCIGIKTCMDYNCTKDIIVSGDPSTIPTNHNDTNKQIVPTTETNININTSLLSASSTSATKYSDHM